MLKNHIYKILETCYLHIYAQQRILINLIQYVDRL